MKEIHPEKLKSLRVEFPNGTRVILIKMDDPYTKLKPGDKGTVTGIDDVGTIFVNWDLGSSLGIVFGEDICRKLID